MASPVESSGQTTQACSIMTLDGYVSHGKAPPNSVPRDHAMLQDFAAYLELRLKSQNLSMLRRIFADFLNEHENTLVPMMHQGCTMITIFPMLRTSAKRRRQAKILLAKPKFQLDSRGCVFVYLQYRAATRNMELLKHLFLEFECHQETLLLEFVERGCQVISVIPFELPQMRLLPPRIEQRESPRVVEAVTEQEQVTGPVMNKTKSKRKGRAPVMDATQNLPSTTPASVPAASVVANVASSLSVVTEPRRRHRKPVKTTNSAASGAAAIPDDPEIVFKRRRNHAAVRSTDKSGYSASSPVAVAVTTSKRGKKKKTSVVPLQEAATVAMEQARAVVAPEQTSVAVAPEQIGATNALELAAVVLEQAGVAGGVSQEDPKRKRERKRKSASQKENSVEEKSHKRGKPAMSEVTLRSQLELALKMESFIAQNLWEESPWEVVYGHLAAPFEVENHPELAKMFHKFWNRHSHAVWERKFWVPISRKLNTPAFNKRNNRQLAAKNAFEALIVAVYEEFGASFFVMLDTQKPRHPGWWYRGPVVALFALQQLKGEDAMWEYVENDAFQRFPDCKLPLPLASTNSGALRSRHKHESESMWMANHPLTAGILQQIAALKGEQQPCEQTTTAEPYQELGSSVMRMDPLELMEPTRVFV